jgi:hypothetical protein
MEPLDPPLSDDDHLLRLVHKNFWTSKAGGKFKPDAFGIHPADTDGVSVFLERPGLASADAVRATRKSPTDFYVARIPVAAIRRDLGLAIDYTAVPTDPVGGHCSLSDLTFAKQEDEATRELIRQRQEQLARLLNDHPEYIIRRPGQPAPTPAAPATQPTTAAN